MAEEILTIETPEHVQLQFSLATIGNRFLACAIDHIIQFIALILIIVIAYNLSEGVRTLARATIGEGSGVGMWVYAIFIVVFFMILFGYFVFFETILSGQTPGKRLLKLRVILGDGRPITFFAALTRNLIRIADLIPGFYSVGIISVFASERAQRLGDY